MQTDSLFVCVDRYALAPLQALFVSPCAHTYHFKCIRPLLQSYPGFQCPICRTYSDLDANINLESHEVVEKFGLRRQSTIIDPTSAMTCITTTTTVTSSQQQSQPEQQSPSSSSSSLSNASSGSQLQQQHTSSSSQAAHPSSTEEDHDTTPLAYITGHTRRICKLPVENIIKRGAWMDGGTGCMRSILDLQRTVNMGWQSSTYTH